MNSEQPKLSLVELAVRPPRGHCRGQPKGPRAGCSSLDNQSTGSAYLSLKYKSQIVFKKGVPPTEEGQNRLVIIGSFSRGNNIQQS